MNGIADFNYPAFHAATADLQARGLIVESPAGHATSGPEAEGRTYDWYLRRAITQLVTCDAVALLDGWRDSTGATLEVQIAETLSMLVRPLHVWQAWLLVAE
jgi:hypothetical protein